MACLPPTLTYFRYAIIRRVADLTRRKLLVAGVPAVASGAVALHSAIPHTHPWEGEAKAADGMHGEHGAGAGGSHTPHGHAGFRDGRTVDHAPTASTRTRSCATSTGARPRACPTAACCASGSCTPSTARSRWRPACTSRPGPTTAASPGPTLRCREGERLRITFVNGSAATRTRSTSTASTRPRWTACPGVGAGEIAPGGKTVYEFDALPAGLHLYHCHVRPLAEHIAKGLYGAFIVDPADGREDADEMVMVHERVRHELRPRQRGLRGEHDRLRVHGQADRASSATSSCASTSSTSSSTTSINSFHLHGNLFDYFPTGTSKRPREFTDTVMLCQGQRGILEWRFPHPGASCSTPTSPSSRSSAGRGSSRWRTDGGAQRHRGAGCAAAGCRRGCSALVPLLLIARGGRRRSPRSTARASASAAGRRSRSSPSSGRCSSPASSS